MESSGKISYSYCLSENSLLKITFTIEKNQTNKRRPALPFDLGCMSNKIEQPWNASCKVCTKLL